MRTRRFLGQGITIATLGLVYMQTATAQAGNSRIPATAATQATLNATPATYAAGTSTPAAVTWTGARLTIHTDGQNLPEVLRQVAHITGMKISGSAPAVPVFGTYGPASVQQVMAALFDGLSVNMLLVNDTAVQPKELLLTARTGGASAPLPQQTVLFDAGNSGDPSDVNLAQPRAGRHTSPYSFQGAPSTPAAGTFAPQTSSTQSTDVPSTGATNTDAEGTPQSPNGVRTPEQIFRELRRRQQSASQQ